MATVELYRRDRGDVIRAEKFAPNVLHVACLDSFDTEQGDRIVNLSVAYRVFGTLNDRGDNLVLVFHALTGDANCAGYDAADGRVNGWWEDLFAPNAAFDLRRWCVVCPNHPLSCYGSSGPLDSAVGGTEPLGPDFPDFSVRDIAAVHHRLLAWMDAPTPAVVIGGSLGGMLALQWAVSYPDEARVTVVIAAPMAGNAQSLAYNHLQRSAFRLDPAFREGRYYGGPRPNAALSLARQMAMITYRNPGEFTERFGRSRSRASDERRKYFQVQGYLEHQGRKLTNRFDANSYLKLLDTLDSHDISGGSGDFAAALRVIGSRMVCIAVDSDVLYPPVEVRALHQWCIDLGVESRFAELSSLHGHDGFLIELEQLDRILKQCTAADRP